jgi:uncharacterized cupredoxin-like copper-binding protein
MAALAMFAFVAVACGDDDDTASDGDNDMADGDMDDGDHEDDEGDHEDDGDMDMGEADVHITLIPLDTFRFETPELTAKVGESLQLTLDNTEGTTLHDFTIRMIPVEDVHAEGAEHDMGDMDMDMLAVHVAADAGGKGVVTFTPTEAGTYEFECSAADGSHKAAGMVGTIVVS